MLPRSTGGPLAMSPGPSGIDITEAELDAAEHDWDGYWSATRAVELTAAVERHAGQLARAHALRGADAVHLASALAIGDPELIIAAWDRRPTVPAHITQFRLCRPGHDHKCIPWGAKPRASVV